MDKLKKVCKNCNKTQEISNFYRNKLIKDGHDNRCKDCEKKRRRKRYLDNKEKELFVNKKWKETNHIYYKKQQSDYYFKNKKDINQKHREHYEKNKDLYNAKTAKRRSCKYGSTPKWSEKDKIKVLYQKAKWLEELTGLKYHVDHIVPLQGKNVCGLHVWENLQILEASTNIKKGNKYDF